MENMDRMKPKNKEERVKLVWLKASKADLDLARQEGEKQEREKIVKMLKDRVKDVKFCQSQDKYQEQIEEDDIIIGEDKWIIQQITSPIKGKTEKEVVEK